MSLVTFSIFSFSGTTDLQFTTLDITTTNLDFRFSSAQHMITFNAVDGTTIIELLPPLNLIQVFFRKINKYLKLNRTVEEIQSHNAEKKSWELVKQWLTSEEFAVLTSKGEMEVQSKQDKNTIYIIKRDPHKVIEEKLYGKRQNRYCIIPKEIELAHGDGFLSKLLLLQNNEAKFKEIAVKSCMLSEIRIGAVCYYKAKEEWSKVDKKAFDEFNSKIPNKYNISSGGRAFNFSDNVTCNGTQLYQSQDTMIENGVVQ